MADSIFTVHDDQVFVVLLGSILSAVTAYLHTRRLANREVHSFLGRERLGSAFGGAAKWSKLERRVARFRYHVNLQQFISTLLSGALGGVAGYALDVIDNLMSSHV